MDEEVGGLAGERPGRRLGPVCWGVGIEKSGNACVRTFQGSHCVRKVGLRRARESEARKGRMSLALSIHGCLSWPASTQAEISIKCERHSVEANFPITL